MMIQRFKCLTSPHMSTHVRAVARSVFIVALMIFATASMARAEKQNEVVKTITASSASVYEVASELVCDCPDCGKKALDQCPTCETGEKYREVIASQLKQGRSKAQIVEYFANTYGEHLLGTPRQQGFGRAAFALPALAVLMGLLPLSLVLRRRKRDAQSTSFDAQSDATGDWVPEAAPAKPAVDDPRVAAALRDYDF